MKNPSEIIELAAKNTSVFFQTALDTPKIIFTSNLKRADDDIVISKLKEKKEFLVSVSAKTKKNSLECAMKTLKNDMIKLNVDRNDIPSISFIWCKFDNLSSLHLEVY